MRVMLSVICDLSPGKWLLLGGGEGLEKRSSTEDDWRQFITISASIYFPLQEKSPCSEVVFSWLPLSHNVFTGCLILSKISFSESFFFYHHRKS